MSVLVIIFYLLHLLLLLFLFAYALVCLRLFVLCFGLVFCLVPLVCILLIALVFPGSDLLTWFLVMIRLFYRLAHVFCIATPSSPV